MGALRPVFPDYVISCDYGEKNFLDLSTFVLSKMIYLTSFYKKLAQLHS